MGPPKAQNNAAKPSQVSLLMRQGVTTRNKSALLGNLGNITVRQPLVYNRDVGGKRKADVSPLKEKTTKRSALGNITNALNKKNVSQSQIQDKKKVIKKTTTTTATKISILNENLVNCTVTKLEEKLQIQNTDESIKDILNKDVQNKVKIVPRLKQLKEQEKKNVTSKTLSVRSNNDLEKSNDSSLYMSALEETNEDINKPSSIVSDVKTTAKEENEDEKIEETVTEDKEHATVVEIKVRKNVPPPRKLPSGVLWDFDAENWQDPYQISPYAQEIFDYLKKRENDFIVGDYMERQVCLSKWMRSMLVDWMVEVQESFELNHETLYLAVKLVDLYLTKVNVGKETLQLLGAASLFIASKYDERIPPMIEDFLYICDGAYTQRELIKMEINVLKVMDFDIGIPLSYRFLRRYARCAKVIMPTLTLARYILEYSLMDYATIRYSDSKIAAAALFLAMYMKSEISETDWNPTLEYYTGYKLSDFKDIILVLNEGLHRKPRDLLSTVRKKYSHKIFFEVAKIPLKEIKDL